MNIKHQLKYSFLLASYFKGIIHSQLLFNSYNKIHMSTHIWLGTEMLKFNTEFLIHVHVFFILHVD